MEGAAETGLYSRSFGQTRYSHLWFPEWSETEVRLSGVPKAFCTWLHEVIKLWALVQPLMNRYEEGVSKRACMHVRVCVVCLCESACVFVCAYVYVWFKCVEGLCVCLLSMCVIIVSWIYYAACMCVCAFANARMLWVCMCMYVCLWEIEIERYINREI